MHVKPIIAIVGRPNVGKSTLFNALTGTRDALVADRPGLTRDRNYGEGKKGSKPYTVVDAGGFCDDRRTIAELVTRESLRAAEEADAVVFLVDGRESLTVADRDIAQRLRSLGKPIHLAVNKTEGLNGDMVCSDFFDLGMQPLPISAAQGNGVAILVESVLASLPKPQPTDDREHGSEICFAVIGRPNVGKSTLVNRMLGEDRVLVFDEPGTTRDSIAIRFERDGKPYILIDTAGVRRRPRISDRVEKFSVIKTLQAINRANVALLIMDAKETITDQDASLIGMILNSGRALVVAVNKWDGLRSSQRQRIRSEVDRKLHFIDFAPVHYISALHGSGLGELFRSIETAFASAFVAVPTASLTRIVENAVAAHPPPLIRGRRIKLRYAHLGGHNPPRVIVHGNQTESVPASYRRYLENTIRASLNLHGTPVRVEFKRVPNPYEGSRNRSSKGQIAKRKRLMRRVK